MTARCWNFQCDSGFIRETAERLRRHRIFLLFENVSEPTLCGLFFFSLCSDALIDEIAQQVISQPLLLCIAQPGLNLSSSFVWQLLQAGATDVLATGPAAIPDQISARLQRWQAVEDLMKSPTVRDNLAGSSRVWHRLLRQIVEVACFTISPVLILGETGTGKERMARLIHGLDQQRNQRDLITVDCTTIVPELSGSELFGHERGAFTGATSSRDGAFALAHQGTLFLDEIGELPLSLQAQLLRAVQEKTYKRVGGNNWNHTDFRLVCATNRDLLSDVSKGLFRSDLYFRLASWVFRLPPLRDRKADILPLARHFLKRFEQAEERDFDPAVADYLESREYPGNVRELRQLVLRMAQRHVGPGPITAGELPSEELPRMAGAARRLWPDAEFEEAIRHGLDSGAELRQISQAASDMAIRISVQKEQGNLQRAAKRLGITDRALQLRRASGQL